MNEITVAVNDIVKALGDYLSSIYSVDAGLPLPPTDIIDLQITKDVSSESGK